MKKEMTLDDCCPHCKRHCPLKSPHCGKGKALAAEIKKQSKSGKEEYKEKSKEKSGWKPERAEIPILYLYQKGYRQLFEEPKRKLESGEMRGYLGAVLIEKGTVTKQDLKKFSGLCSEDIGKAVKKMEKSGDIIFKKEKGMEDCISLTPKGIRQAEEYGKKMGTGVLTALSEEEKQMFKEILKKLVRDS